MATTNKVPVINTQPPAVSKDEASVLINKMTAARTRFYASFTRQVSNPDVIKDLDSWRNKLPSVIAKRYKSDPDETHITLSELQKLLRWKLSKGKFRPSLPRLVAENSDESVIGATREGFKMMLEIRDLKKKDKDGYLMCIKGAVKAIVVLRGVGPAMASLILSLLCEISTTAPPFYSDEAAAFVLRQLKGDVPKLKYSLSEYLTYCGWWYDLCGPEFSLNMTTLEQGAWCLRLQDLGFIIDGDEVEDGSDTEKEELEEQPKSKRQKR